VGTDTGSPLAHRRTFQATDGARQRSDPGSRRLADRDERAMWRGRSRTHHALGTAAGADRSWLVVGDADV